MKKPFKTLQQRSEAEARNQCADLETKAESSTETQPALHGKFQSPVSKLKQRKQKEEKEKREKQWEGSGDDNKAWGKKTAEKERTIGGMEENGRWGHGREEPSQQ